MTTPTHTPTPRRRDRLRRIMEILTANPAMSIRDLADTLKMSVAPIHLDIDYLRAQGLVTRHGRQVHGVSLNVRFGVGRLRQTLEVGHTETTHVRFGSADLMVPTGFSEPPPERLAATTDLAASTDVSEIIGSNRVARRRRRMARRIERIQS
jgi:predicted DNA-binding transcriptional regulator YafY